MSAFPGRPQRSCLRTKQVALRSYWSDVLRSETQNVQPEPQLLRRSAGLPLCKRMACFVYLPVVP